MSDIVFELIDSINDGGAESLVREYALLLQENKIDVRVITLYENKKSANYRVLKENNIKVSAIYRKWNLLTRVVNRFFGRFIVTLKLKKYISHNIPSAIHIHQSLLKYVSPLSNMIDQKGIKLFYTCHSLPNRYFSGKNYKEQIAAKLLIQKNQLQMIALHEHMAQELNVMFNIDNTLVLKNGVDFKKFRGVSETKQELRHCLGVPSDAFVLGHIGRFVDVKNHTFIVDVFFDVYQKRKDTFLLLVGDGVLKDSIEKKLKDLGLQNHYLILSNRSDIPQLLKTMDVFVFPSKYEGLPITLIEAQVVGLKCIVSDTVSAESIVSKNAIQIPLNDLQIWSDSIVSKAETDIYGDIESFDMRRVVKKLIELYF